MTAVRTDDGRLVILLLSHAARLEERAAGAPCDVAADLLAAARFLREDAGQEPVVIRATQTANVQWARRWAA